MRARASITAVQASETSKTTVTEHRRFGTIGQKEIARRFANQLRASTIAAKRQCFFFCFLRSPVVVFVVASPTALCSTRCPSASHFGQREQQCGATVCAARYGCVQRTAPPPPRVAVSVRANTTAQLDLADPRDEGDDEVTAKVFQSQFRPWPHHNAIFKCIAVLLLFV